jgi:alpha-amylase
MRVLDLNWTRSVTGVTGTQVGWPTPTATTCMYSHVAQQMPEFKAAGFTHLLFPPPCLGAGGRLSDGYDLKNNYELDGTAFGDKEELIAAIAAAHALGLKVGLDLTLHQYDGYPNQIYPTLPFPKKSSCFAVGQGQRARPGNVQPDSVPDQTGNWPDGDLAAYDQPDRYMWNNSIIWAQWLIKTVGYDFLRIDEAKGMHAPFIHALLTSPGIIDLFAVAEYFDGQNYALGGYVNYWQQQRVSVYDFGFKFNVQNICNNNSKVWMGALANIGYCTVDPMHAVTFLESHDTDNSPGEQLIWNKALGYAIMHTFPGCPMTYYRDWSTDANCYGLKRTINNQLWIHEHLAQGDFVVRLDTDPQVFAHERMGYGSAPGCVCIFNNDQYNQHTNRIQTRYWPGTRLHEFTGNGGYANDRWTDGNGCITVTTPRNNNGLSYLVYGLNQ